MISATIRYKNADEPTTAVDEPIASTTRKQVFNGMVCCPLPHARHPRGHQTAFGKREAGNREEKTGRKGGGGQHYQQVSFKGGCRMRGAR